VAAGLATGVVASRMLPLISNHASVEELAAAGGVWGSLEHLKQVRPHSPRLHWQ
jgi:hypothetical protein